MPLSLLGPEWLRQAEWLNAPRARTYAIILLALTWLLLAAWFLFGVLHSDLDPLGRPIGADFPSFWAAGRLAIEHQPQLAYDVRAHWNVQSQAFAGHPVGYAAFFYPPPYLALCMPFALAPYLGALGAFLAFTALVLGLGLRPLVRDRSTMVALAAFPAVMSNIANGQNAFLTTGLLALGCLSADRRPGLSGAALGCLVVKPHLAVMAPLGLLFAGRWKTLGVAGATAAGLCAVSWLMFRTTTWLAFLKNGALAQTTLELGLVGDAKMQSAFAGARLIGASLPVAWSLQGAVSLSVIVITALCARRDRNPQAVAAIVAAAATLVSPFLLDYDLMLAAIPMLWLFNEARARGFRPYEKVALFAAYITPAIARIVATIAHTPITPLAMFALFVCVARRMAWPSAPALSPPDEA